MSPDRSRRLEWWLTRVGLPAVGLALIAILIGRSAYDRASLEPFYDAEAGAFPLRRDGLFGGVLHHGGRSVVVGCTAVLVLGAALGWRNPRWSSRARRFAYLAACLLVTVAITGAWKKLADQTTPWDTLGFGGTKAWPGSDGRASLWDVVGSPGAHASSGFAWVSLYFVGASLRSRHRWLWAAPGLLLGLLFAFAQHARGAHQPSHEPWSIAVAWIVAGVLAVLFRRLGWLTWSEFDAPPVQPVVTRERALPWLVGASVALCGLAFLAADQCTEVLGSQPAGLRTPFEYVVVLITAAGLGITAGLLTDKLQSLREREASRRGAARAPLAGSESDGCRRPTRGA